MGQYAGSQVVGADVNSRTQGWPGRPEVQAETVRNANEWAPANG